ncbi:class I SAM-dependent methyltransferase [Acerihabitans arboris]|uniref:Methyltransferase domain-containing protein n=1 Tax=Acerihabitans arboris TaxID=2691583 RepID=A0A845SNL8_9GAMM|nr:class I SAM-dependent methyltransferase [Acerihabitans arboris]NDL64128.1 methyltransferase domain-containing protein [Acerihabitans arboris]
MADQGSEGLLSPYLRRKRIQAAAPYLTGRTLDFGCGSGALAAQIDAGNYVGVEIDSLSLRLALKCFPKHAFVAKSPELSEKFDTVVSLAVIEHVKDSADFLRTLAAYMRESPSSRIVVTTPHPSVDWVHHLGASIGLFSKHASEEHEALLDRSKLEAAGKQAGLDLIYYRRFLFGANQIAIYAKSAL